MHSNNTATKKEHAIGGMLLFMVLVVYTLMQWRQLHADIWNDEMYTLKHFVLVYFRETVTDYHVPNNHVFFSIFEKFFLKIFRQKDLLLLLDKPWIARIPGLLCSYATIIYVYAFGKKYYSLPVAVLSIILLISTVPFFNFALQIRGYSLNMLFAAMIIYYFFGYLHTAQKQLLFVIGILIALTIYTIPSNLYFAIPFLLFCAVAAFICAVRSGRQQKFIVTLFTNLWSYLAYSITGGIILSLVLYAPMLHAVFFNPYVAPPTPFNKWVLSDAFPEVFEHITSYRYLFFLPLIPACLWIKNKKDRTLICLLLSLMIVPFIMGFLRGDWAPSRVYVYMAPLFIILCMPFAHQIFVRMNRHWQPVLFITIVAAYCVFCFQKVMKMIDEKLYHNLYVGDMDMGLYYNYFAMHYAPYDETKNFRDHYNHPGAVLILKDSEPHDMPYYLEHFKLKYYTADALDSLMQKQDTVFVITRFPYNISDEVLIKHPGWKAHFVYKEITYHNFVQLYHVASAH